MKQYDERIYRKSAAKPTLEDLRAQLMQCRQDYERLADRMVADDLKRALQTKIADLETQIADAKRRATEAPSRDPDRLALAPGAATRSFERRRAGKPRMRATRI